MTIHYQNLELACGEDARIDIPLYSTDGVTPLPIDGALEFDWHVKRSPAAASPDLILKKLSTGGIVVTQHDVSASIITVIVADSDTLTPAPLSDFFWHELWITDAAGNRDKLLDGSCAITPSTVS